jgi:hypothetical protein
MVRGVAFLATVPDPRKDTANVFTKLIIRHGNRTTDLIYNLLSKSLPKGVAISPWPSTMLGCCTEGMCSNQGQDYM